MKHLIKTNIHNKNPSNLPNDLNELLRDFKRKKTSKNINISNLPTSKQKNHMENLQDYTTEKINKNSFVKKYNDIMSHISNDYIVIQPKSNAEAESRKNLKILNLNNFIKEHIKSESPLKNIKKEILNTKLDEMNFDNFYLDSRKLNNIAKLSDTNKLLKDFKKNELLTCNGQSQINLNSSFQNKSKSVNNSKTLRFVKEKSKDEEFENSNCMSIHNNSSIKNEFSKISNILNFANFNKTFVKRNNASKDEYSESLPKNSNFFNSIKNSTGKTFYSTLTKSPNSRVYSNNQNECIISNYSQDSISLDKKFQSNDNIIKINKYKTCTNFFNCRNSNRTNDRSIDNQRNNVLDNSIINNNLNNFNYKNNKSSNKGESKTNLFDEKYKTYNCKWVEKLTDKINFENIDSLMKKRESSIDASSQNHSNFNSSKGLNIFKNEMNNGEFINGYNNPDSSFREVNNSMINKYKNCKKNSSLDVLNEQVPPVNFSNKNEQKEKMEENFCKVNSLNYSNNSFNRKSKNKINNIYTKKYLNIENITGNSNNNTSRLDKSNNSFSLNIYDQINSKNAKNSEIESGIVYQSNFEQNKKEFIRKPISFELIKDQPCKYNKFNNFYHLREEIDYSDLMKKRNKNVSNFSKFGGGNCDNEFTFSKSTNSFMNKSNILNKIDATKRLKLN